MSRTCFDHYQHDGPDTHDGLGGNNEQRSHDGPDTHDRHDGNYEQPCEVLIKEEGLIGLSLGAHDVFGHL